MEVGRTQSFDVWDTTLYYYRIGRCYRCYHYRRVRLYHAAAIPAPRDIRGYSFPLYHQNSVVLCDNADGNRNSVIKSAPNTLNTFNGLDSYEWFLGNEDAIVAGASLFLRFGSSVQDMLVLCKKNEVHLLEGNGSDCDPYRTRMLTCECRVHCAAYDDDDTGGRPWEAEYGGR